MRLVLARCTVDYVGRLTAHLPEATRLLVLKADGSLLVHSDTGGYKPLMWMTPPCTTLEADGVWTVTNKGGEQLLVTVHEVLSDVSHELGTDPGLVKDGVEKHLQQLLADQVHVLGQGFELVQREYFTDIGPVDLLVRDAAGLHVLVEVKRHAEIDGVEQLTRYLQRVETVLGVTTGILAAQSFKPQAKVLAADRGITCVQLDYEALRGMESQRLTLF
ncbi:MAG: endonuclease NucS [Actinomycetota bacterium]|nr:endonuclease NucS [Actinomycetota bacterium]